MIIDTETLPREYRARVERVMDFLADDRKLKVVVDKLMEKTGRRISLVAQELGINRMALYRVYERLDERSPTPGPPPKVDFKLCPYCGSEKWERVKRLYHCLNPECGLEFRGPHAYRRYVFMSVEKPGSS